METNVLDWLEVTAAACPDKPAFLDEDSAVTFADVRREARIIGTAAAKFRAGQKRPIAVMSGRNAHTPAVFLGAVYAGCCYAPMDGTMPVHRLNSILNTLDTDLMIVQRAFYDKAKTLDFSGTILIAEELLAGSEDAALLADCRARARELDPLYIIFTSGSTGTPKGIVISHRAILDFTDWLTDFCGYTEHEVFGNQSPFYFDTSCKDLYQTLKLGATCVILEKKFFALPLFLLQALAQHGVTAVNWATSAFHLVASSGALEKCVPHALRKIVVGGEALQARYVNMWKRAIPEADLYNMYGPTETTVDCAALHLTRTYRDDEPIPIGRACRNMQLLLLKDDLTEAAPGETGELCVRGSGLAAGYFADAEKTNSAFIQNPLCPDYRDILYRTGDMAVQREDGNFYFLARRDGQIKHMGYRIELGEIETALYSVDGLHDAVCFYDAMRDRIVCVYAGNLDTNTLAKALRTALPKYMLPNVYEKLEALPHNANGKLDRAALKERFLHAQS